jgi:hypothetical protein
MALDRDPAVGMRSAGPLELRWHRGGRRQWMRPAFVARRAGVREVVLVQPQEVTDRWQVHQQVAASAAQAAGWQVRVVQPPEDLDLENLKLLYAASDTRWVPAQHQQQLLAHIPGPRSIRSAVQAAGLPRFTGVDIAYHLLWRRALHFDTASRLTPGSLVWRDEPVRT